MSYPIGVATQIEIGRASMYLSRNGIKRDKFLKGVPYFEQLLPLLIAMETDILSWQYNFVTIAVNARATITITSVPTNGYNIEAIVNDPDNGSISLGSYIKGGGDTTTSILATSIATELDMNGYGYGANAVDNIITITARSGLGSSINGSNLSVTANITPEVKARAFLAPTRTTTGTVYTTTVVDPNLGSTILSTYTQQVTDTTSAIFIASLIADINNNAYGYTCIPYLANVAFYVIAPTGEGSSINGNSASIAWLATSNSTTFAGGVDEAGIIPNTLIQFSGGIFAANSSVLIGEGNYLYALCGRYAIDALNALGQGGSEVVIIPAGSSGSVVSIAGQIVELTVDYPAQANPAGSPTPSAGDTVVTLNYKVMPNTENIFYQGVPVKLYPDLDFNYIPNYGSTTTTYTFSAPLDSGFALKFDFMKIVSESSGGTSRTSSGLQAVYVTANATSNTITVVELGTFMFAQIRGATYDTGVITQTGQDLDLTNVGGAVSGETYLIFYYPTLL